MLQVGMRSERRDWFGGPVLPVGAIVLLWAGTRIAYGLATYISSDLHLYSAHQGFYGGVLAWQRWDANWYVLISRLGYWSPPAANFFPLHPFLIGALAWLLGDGAGPVFPHPDQLRLLLGMAVSNLGLLAGLLALGYLAQREADPSDLDAGPRLARMVLAYPFAMAWAIAYADGLFFGLAALTLLSAREGHWSRAALTAALAGLTRPVAVILVLPLLWEFGQQHGWWRWPLQLPQLRPRQLLLGTLAIVAVPLTMAAYLGSLWLHFGDPLLVFHNLSQEWARSPRLPWWTIGHGLHRVLTLDHTSVLALELGLGAAIAAITLLSLGRVPPTYGLWVAGILYIAVAAPISNQTDLIWGSGRYFADAVPVFLILTRWTARRPWLDGLLLASGTLIQGVLTVALFQGVAVF